MSHACDVELLKNKYTKHYYQTLPNAGYIHSLDRHFYIKVLSTVIYSNVKKYGG